MKNWFELEPDKYCLMNKHYTPGRPGPIEFLVIHHNAGIDLSTEDCHRIWQDREASAHYQVETAGTIGQLVNDWDTAWHAGNANANAAFATLNLPGSGTVAATTDPDGAASRNSCPPRSLICTADTV